MNLHFKVYDSLSFIVLVDLEKGREWKLKEAEIKAVRKGRNGNGREGKERNEKGKKGRYDNKKRREKRERREGRESIVKSGDML